MMKERKRSYRGLRRRDFLAGTTTAAVLASSSTFLPDAARAQTPKRGGVVRIATEVTSATASLDPPFIQSNTDITRGWQIYNSLVRLDEKFEVQPSLAETWEMAKPDATEWVFELRQGVVFHNGKAFNSADVVWNLQRHMGEKSESRSRALMAEVKDVLAEDDKTVRIVLAKPNADFPAILTDPHLVFSPKGYVNATHPIGTGPFKMGEFTPGGASFFVRNENYWNAENVFIDAIEVVAIPDPVNRLNSVLSGDQDFGLSADVNAVLLIDKSDTADKVLVRSGRMVCLIGMCDRTPTSNVDFRMALKYLQDRQKVVDAGYKGFAQIGNDHPVAPIDPMYCADLPLRGYDPDKARFHLKKAGMEDASVDIRVAAAAGPGLVEQALILRETAAAAGLRINVLQVPGEGYWNTTYMKYPLVGTHWNARARVEHLFSLVLDQQPKSKYNETAFIDQRIDGLLASLRSEPDLAKRKQSWCDLQTIVYEEGGYFLPAFPDFIHAKSKKLKGFVPNPTGAISDFLNGEGLWLNS